MADSVLYFPSIRVPQTEWFTRTLLYWDSVGTIVPEEYQQDPHFLRPYTAGLRDCGLLKTIAPDTAVYNARNYYGAFLALLDGFYPAGGRESSAPHETVQIHVDKTGYGLASELVRRGLASQMSGQEWSAWYEVEKDTGNLLMAYLAALLGQTQEHRMDPITDDADCLKAFTRVPSRTSGIESRVGPIRTEILVDLLPAPADSVQPAQLAQFKERHRNLLTGFRTTVEQRLVSAAAIEDPALRERSIGLIRTELKGQREEIERRMQENAWVRIGFGTLLAVVAAGVTVADAAVSGGMLTIGAASLGLTSAVYSAFEGTRTPRDLLSHPMAYAALAHQKLGH